MSQAESTLITSRRNFLVRASALTVAGATVAIPIITVADARARMQHHADQLVASGPGLLCRARCIVHREQAHPRRYPRPRWPPGLVGSYGQLVCRPGRCSSLPNPSRLEMEVARCGSEFVTMTEA